jgi:rSAM/selenodomain-associated transferase 1
VSAAIAILTRSPADPRLKERLKPVIADATARREVALAFLDDLVARVTAMPAVTLKVAVTPPVEGLRMSRPSILWNQLLPQRGASFGERLQHVIVDLAAAGFTQVILLGADVPDLPPACLEEAVRVLQEQPQSVVIGPSGDGSYYLLGLSVRAHRVPDLLSAVRWGTPHMLEDTEAAAEAQGLPVHRVPSWHDVDAPEDLTALIDRLRQNPAAAPHTAEALRRCQLMTPASDQSSP